MKFLNDSLMTWEKTGKEVTLLEFITSKLENIFHLKSILHFHFSIQCMLVLVTLAVNEVLVRDNVA